MRIADDLYAMVLESMPIACVDLLVTDRDDRVLLIERLNPPARGAWWFPGGRVLRDELRLDAALRKLREECGLESVKSREVGTFDLLFEEAHGISTVFHLLVEQTEVRLDAQSGRYAWRSRAQWLEQSLHPFVAAVLRA